MMQVGGKLGSLVLGSASTRSTLEQENAALRLALVQAQEDLAVVQEVAQVASTAFIAPARAALRSTTR